MKWYNYGVDLIKPSKDQCQEVISKLKENNYHKVGLFRSSSFIVQFLLPQLLEIRTITSITLSATKVTKDDIAMISSQLSNNKTLVTLAITDDSIDDYGVIALALSLQCNQSITDLHLDNNPGITSTSVWPLAKLVLCNTNILGVLSLHNTKIDTDKALVLVESLRKNMTLGRLWLDKRHEETCYRLPYYQKIKNRLDFR